MRRPPADISKKFSSSNIHEVFSSQQNRNGLCACSFCPFVVDAAARLRVGFSSSYTEIFLKKIEVYELFIKKMEEKNRRKKSKKKKSRNFWKI